MPRTPTFRLVHGDCLPFLDSLVPGSAHAAIVDPPYASGSPEAKLSNQTPDVKYTQSGQKARWVDFEGDTLDQRSWLRFAGTWLRGVRRALVPGGYLLAFIDWRQLPLLTDAVQIAGFTWRSIVAWDKGPGTRAPGRGRFRHQCEYVVVASNGKLPPSAAAHFGVLPGCLNVPIDRKDKHHMTGKPVELLRRLAAVCPPGGTVLDCFAGSGSTGVACLEEGLSFIGCELSAHYHAVAERRLAAAMRGERLLSTGPTVRTLAPTQAANASLCP